VCFSTNIQYNEDFEVLSATSTAIVVFWDVTSCNLVKYTIILTENAIFIFLSGFVSDVLPSYHNARQPIVEDNDF
jgi:hypothetical protein